MKKRTTVNQRRRDRSSSVRQGAILICVLVCMGIATAIVLTSVRSSLQARRQMRRELQLEQTRWLVDAGMNHALTELREQADYQGETWQVDPALSAYTGATIEISLGSDDVADQYVRISVIARIPGQDQTAKPTQRSGSIIVPIPTTNSAD